MTAKERYQAGRADLVYWLRSRGETLKKSGSEWEWSHQGERVTVRNNVWFDQYTQEGGDAVKFLQYFYGMSEERAVAEHLGCSLFELDDVPQHLRPTRKPVLIKKAEPKPNLTPPAANTNMRRVFAYLCQTRGIDPEVVSAFAHAHILYESADKHNAVFVGKDEHGGKVKHIHMRGTLTDGHFRQTLEGSEKAYSFHYTGSGPRLYVFEAPIDMLSYISIHRKSLAFSAESGKGGYTAGNLPDCTKSGRCTLHPENWQENSYVALCGVGSAPIQRFLDEVPQLEEVVLCLDNDEAGHKATERIARELLDEWNVVVSSHFPDCKDWNDELLAGQEETQEPVMAM
ncbi:DUF3991 and toprim domain-containing protein [Acutalibacter muris]|jgi:hypothetical protein|uniref:DUF3991 and toprim domain-containing protein n=1 Tax=Acutalibacter muris TaxID=1796620 RepID=UPI001C3EA150|nr:DUF3991 and toprim domain-containing protein [Acutalibacter muris]